MDLEFEVQKIKERNARVEADKAWETSVVRRLSIAVLTYAFIVLFLFAAGLPRPFVSALVPVAGYVLSTLSLSIARSLWVRHYARTHPA